MNPRYKMLRFCLCLIFAFSIFDAVQVAGQDDRAVPEFTAQDDVNSVGYWNRRMHKYVTSAHTDRFWIDINGEISFVATPIIRVVGQKPLIDFLNHPAVRHELTFVDEQDKKLRSITSDFDAAIRKYEAWQKDTAEERKTTRQLVEHLAKTNMDVAKRLEGFLLKHQQERMSQLVVRNYLRRTGLLGQLTNGELGKKIDVTNAQKELLKQKAAALIPGLKKDTAELRRQLVETLLDVLTRRQREQLQEQLFEDLNNTDLPVGLMIVQLATGTDDEVKAFNNKNPWPDLGALGLPYEYDLDPLGQFALPKIDNKMDEEDFAYPVYTGLMEIMGMRRHQQKNYQDVLGITQSQIGTMKKLDEASEQLRREFDETSSRQTAVDWREAWKKYCERNADLRRQSIDEMLKSLSTTQREKLSKIVNSIGVYRMGLLMSLLSLELGKSIDVTKDQKKELLSVAKKLVDEMTNKTRKIEAKFENDLLSVLTYEQREMISGIAGEPPKGAIANLTMIIMQSDRIYAENYLRGFDPDLKIDFEGLKLKK